MQRILRKLGNNRGESIAELLIAILVSVLGITLLAIMIQTSSKMILSSKDNIKKYSENENKIVTRNGGIKDETTRQINILTNLENPEVLLYKGCGDLKAIVYRFEFGNNRIMTFDWTE